MILSWSPELETGNAIVDTQHREIFKLVQEVLDAASSSHGNLEIKIALGFLSKYAVNHFASEEELMAQSDYPKYAEHKEQHANFVKAVVNFIELYKREGDSVSVVDTVNDFVIGWLKEHIMTSDKAMARYYNEKTGISQVTAEKKLEISDVSIEKHPQIPNTEEIGTNLSQISWSKDLETGNVIVDDQHREIFNLVQEVLNTAAYSDKKEETKASLGFLSNYAVNHFASEEELMVQSNYPKYAEHKEQHVNFVKTVVDFIALYKKEGSSVSVVDTVNNFVVGWLKDHIMTSDKAMAEYYSKKTGVFQLTFGEDVETGDTPIELPNQEILGTAKASNDISQISWSKELETGNVTVDDQHREIFNLVQEVLNTAAYSDKKEETKASLGFLSSYAVRHFASEEELMLKLNYPQYDSHKEQHENFIKTVVDFIELYKREGASVSVSDTVNNFVVGWLKDHIMTSDKAMAKYYSEKTSIPQIAFSKDIEPDNVTVMNNPQMGWRWTWSWIEDLEVDKQQNRPRGDLVKKNEQVKKISTVQSSKRRSPIGIKIITGILLIVVVVVAVFVLRDYIPLDFLDNLWERLPVISSSSNANEIFYTLSCFLLTS